MQITYLILTYQRPEGLAGLLDSIAAQALPEGAKSRMIIWDNDPASRGDRSLESRHRGAAELRYIVARKNHKLEARRLLEDVAFEGCGPDDTPSDDVVVHLDDDVVLEPGWLIAAVEASRRRNWGAVGSVESYEGRLVYSGQTRLNLADMTIDGRPIKVWRWEWQDVPAQVGEVAAVFAGHRALLVNAGLAARARHDPCYRIGGEDLDYSLTLTKAGGQIGLSPLARIVHRGHGEEDAFQFRSRDDVVSSWRHFYRKWGFVRLNAATEAGMDENSWLRVVSGVA
jgi:hypothetical protein